MEREMRLARAKAAYERWSAFRSGSFPHPYLHPPDLFSFDPCVEKPYLVPATFIPTMVGGNIEIRNRSRGVVRNEGSETTEFILGNFLPGGYKKRWNFRHFRTFWIPSEWKERNANIERSFSISRSQPLDEISAGDTFSPLKIPANQTTIYFPDAVNVEEIPPHAHYFWEEERLYLDHTGEGSVKVARDPLSIALWENILLTKERPDEEYLFPVINLIESIGYYPDFRIARCYYGNALQLLGPNLTRVIRFVHDKDQQYALVGTEHISQAVRLNINLKSFLAALPEVLEKDPILTSDLQWKFFLLKLNESVLFHGKCAESTYDLSWIQTLCNALDFWMRQDHPDTNIRSFFNETPEQQQVILRELIPEGKEIRLRLAGFDLRKRDDIVEWLTEHGKEVAEILDEVYSPEAFESYVQTVICETFQRTLNVWCQQFFSVVGDGLVFWQEGTIENDFLSLYAYDRYQGGSGISRELFKHLQQISSNLSNEIHTDLKRTLQCDVDIADIVIHDIFSNFDSDYVWSVFREPSGAPEEIIRNSLKKQEKIRAVDFGLRRKEDLIIFVRLEIRRLIHSKESAAMYAELIRGYRELREKLGRTPMIIDLLLYSSASLFYDPRAAAAFERYRTVKKGDLSEVHVRVGEMIPACVDACPECLEIDEFYGARPNASLLVDRRLLLALLEMI
ncbi:hypothetical protein [Methanocalculus sp.]|uniref:hypothetical protein n=1 Tax=Methanocalculus sp. TaxID=2004547 RepID=UPI002629D4AB|nr:hypothetical protein [Methanocalculus sp.]MDG6250878.1 hypothetical protein [Methanocalculus sp.]